MSSSLSVSHACETLFWILGMMNQSLMSMLHQTNVDIEDLASEEEKVDRIFKKLKYQLGGLRNVKTSVKNVLLKDEKTSFGCRQHIKLVSVCLRMCAHALSHPLIGVLMFDQLVGVRIINCTLANVCICSPAALLLNAMSARDVTGILYVVWMGVHF
jgi:hypothetical protein